MRMARSDQLLLITSALSLEAPAIIIGAGLLSSPAFPPWMALARPIGGGRATKSDPVCQADGSEQDHFAQRWPEAQESCKSAGEQPQQRENNEYLHQRASTLIARKRLSRLAPQKRPGQDGLIRANPVNRGWYSCRGGVESSRQRVPGAGVPKWDNGRTLPLGRGQQKMWTAVQPRGRGCRAALWTRRESSGESSRQILLLQRFEANGAFYGGAPERSAAGRAGEASTRSRIPSGDPRVGDGKHESPRQIPPARHEIHSWFP